MSCLIQIARFQMDAFMNYKLHKKHKIQLLYKNTSKRTSFRPHNNQYIVFNAVVQKVVLFF